MNSVAFLHPFLVGDCHCRDGLQIDDGRNRALSKWLEVIEKVGRGEWILNTDLLVPERDTRCAALAGLATELGF